MANASIRGRRLNEGAVGWLLFAVAAVLAAVLMLLWTRGASFALDEWSFIVNYDGWAPATLLHPDNPHLIVVPVAIYKLLIELFGLGSHLPFLLYSVTLDILVAGLLYEYARRRLGTLFGLAPAVLVLFLGAGWEVAINPAGVDYGTAAACGLGMLLALERRDLKGDVAACVLLAAVLASFTVGLAFAAGAAVALACRGRRKGLPRWWVVAVPLALYFAWFAWAQHFSDNQSTVSTGLVPISHSVVDQLGAIALALTGTFHFPGIEGIDNLDAIIGTLAGPLVVALVLACGVALVFTRPRVQRLLPPAAILAVYLLLVALGEQSARAPEASRYVWMGSLLLLVLLIELGVPLRSSRWLQVACFALVAFALVANVRELHLAGRFLSQEGGYNRAELAAAELVRGRTADFPLETAFPGLLPKYDLGFPASMYFRAVDEHGSPADSQAEIATAAEGPREAADNSLARAFGIEVASPAPSGLGPRGAGLSAVRVTGGRLKRNGTCLVLTPRGGGRVRLIMRVPARGLTIAADDGAGVMLALRRFASRFSVRLEFPRASGLLRIPSDRSARPWLAAIASSKPLRACPAPR